MKQNEKISEAACDRYARALLASAEEAGVLEEIYKNLADLAALFTSDKNLNSAVFLPSIGRSERLKILFEITDALSFHERFFEFLQLLVAKRRLAILPGINARFKELYDERKKQVKVFVKTAVPLSAGQKKTLSGALSGRLGKQILLQEEIDEGIIGGIYLRAKDEVFDFSVESNIDRLKELIRGET